MYKIRGELTLLEKGNSNSSSWIQSRKRRSKNTIGRYWRKTGPCLRRIHFVLVTKVRKKVSIAKQTSARRMSTWTSPSNPLESQRCLICIFHMKMQKAKTSSLRCQLLNHHSNSSTSRNQEGIFLSYWNPVTLESLTMLEETNKAWNLKIQLTIQSANTLIHKWNC